MAKENNQNNQVVKKQPEQKQPSSEEDNKQVEFLNSLPKEARQKLEDIKKKLELFKDELLKKFDKYIVGVALLPPRRWTYDET